MRILIAEDELSIAKALKVVLERNKYTVDMVHNGEDATDYLEEFSYDVIVLDIMMPKKDGLEVLRDLRNGQNATPVLLLTAKGEVEDRIVGLDAGADDYLPKPFATGEFLARVRALSRRSGNFTPKVLTFGKTTLDGNHYLLSCGELSVSLNNKEYQLMEMLLKYPRQVFSSERLMDSIWSVESEAGVGVVWTYMGFLRKKLKEIDADVEIRTVRGAGYALEEKA